MSETPERDEIVRAGREAFEPSDEVRERVFAALASRLGGDLESDWAKEKAGGSAASKGASSTVLRALAGVGAVSAGLFLALRSLSPLAGPADRKPNPIVPSVLVPSAAMPSVAVPSVVATPSRSAQASAAVSPKAPTVRKADDGLAEEVAILSRAGAELRAGRPEAALALVADHQRRFPSGMLAQERVAARAQALCALGRGRDASAELKRLARMSPNSPLEARARKVCGSALDE